MFRDFRALAFGETMLTLQIEPVQGSHSHSHSIGPVPYFKIERDELKTGPDDTIIAKHKGHGWEHRGSSYIVLTVPASCLVTFHGGTTHGPFEQLRIVDGFIRAGDGQRLAGYIEDVALWFAYPENKHYDALTIASTATKNNQQQ